MEWSGCSLVRKAVAWLQQNVIVLHSSIRQLALAQYIVACANMPLRPK